MVYFLGFIKKNDGMISCIFKERNDGMISCIFKKRNDGMISCILKGKRFVVFLKEKQLV